MTVECDPHAAGIFAPQTNQPDDKNTGYFLRCELMVGGGEMRRNAVAVLSGGDT